MFGINKITEKLERCWEMIKHTHEELDDWKGLCNKKLNIDDLVKCDTCKCLLYKDDAIKGESRIVPSPRITELMQDVANFYFGEGNSTITPKEHIEEVYYCHKCQEDKCQKKPLKSEGKSKQTRIIKSAKKSQSKVK